MNFIKRLANTVYRFVERVNPFARSLPEPPMTGLLSTPKSARLVMTPVKEWLSSRYATRTLEGNLSMYGGFLSDAGVIDEVATDVAMHVRTGVKHAWRAVFDAPPAFFASTKVNSNKRNIKKQIKDVLEGMTQSNQYLPVQDVKVTIQYFDTPRGAGSAVPTKRAGVYAICNDDNLCGQRCLVLGMANKKKRCNLKNREAQFSKEARALADEIGVEGAMSFLDFEKFVEKYPKYKVSIYKSSQVGGVVEEVHETGDETAEAVNLMYDSEREHYDFIHVLGSVIKKKYTLNYCKKCQTKYAKTCKCAKGCACPDCGTPATKTRIRVAENHAREADSAVYNQHLEKVFFCCGKVQVQKIEMPKNRMWCKQCCKTFENKSCGAFACKEPFGVNSDGVVFHQCGWYFCRTCQKDKPFNHRCEIAASPLSSKFSKMAEVWSYDMESELITTEVMDKATGMMKTAHRHHPTLVMCRKRNCDGSSEPMVTFEGDNALSDFCDFALSKSNTTFIAHNSKGYDGWLVNQYLTRKTKTRPKNFVTAGSKVMSMTFPGGQSGIKFIDSLNHIAQPLEAFPKTFGLDTKDFKKGFYPYRFNTRDNRNYIGPIPDKTFFDPEMMKADKFQEFQDWHNQKVTEGYVWDHAKETREYCESDVNILHEGLKVYSRDGFDCTGIDPLHCTTIASYAMKVFQTKFHDREKFPIYAHTADEYHFIRRGFFGGRTECFKSFREWTPAELARGEGGAYDDIQSMYPSVQRYDQLPYGPPTHVDYSDQDLTADENAEIVMEKYGFFEVDVECNRSLYCPVLASHSEGGKLVFDLLDKSRRVYHSAELRMALKHGYKITKLYKSIQYKSTNLLFKGYVDKFLETKVNASGHPGLEGLEYKDWVTEHETRFGFTPAPSKNPGKKAIAKLMLNSLWGKFAQRANMVKTEWVSTPKRWFNILEMLTNGTIIVHSVDPVDEGEVLFVKYEEALTNSNAVLTSTSVALAASVTANARCRLYEQLAPLGDRVIYCDTDSIVYEYKPGHYNVPQGKFLGEWEDELGGAKMRTFVSTGAKSYSYELTDSKQETKCKGVTLNQGNSLRINMDALVNLVTGKVLEIVTGSNLDFKLDGKAGEIRSSLFQKKIQFTADKREANGYDSLPFGHEKI